MGAVELKAELEELMAGKARIAAADALLARNAAKRPPNYLLWFLTVLWVLLAAMVIDALSHFPVGSAVVQYPIIRETIVINESRTVNIPVVQSSLRDCVELRNSASEVYYRCVYK